MPTKTNFLSRATWDAITRPVQKTMDNEIHAYRPLLAAWLLRLTLQCKWTQPRLDNLPILEDEEFAELSGLDIDSLQFERTKTAMTMP